MITRDFVSSVDLSYFISEMYSTIDKIKLRQKD